MSEPIDQLDNDSIANEEIKTLADSQQSLKSFTYNLSQKNLDDIEDIHIVNVINSIVEIVAKERAKQNLDKSELQTYQERLETINESQTVHTTLSIENLLETKIEDNKDTMDIDQYIPVNEFLINTVKEVEKMHGMDTLRYIFHFDQEVSYVEDLANATTIEFTKNSAGYRSQEEMIIQCQHISDKQIKEPEFSEDYEDENSPWRAWITDFILENQNSKQIVDSTETVIEQLFTLKGINHINDLEYGYGNIFWNPQNDNYYISQQHILRVRDRNNFETGKIHSLLSKQNITDGKSRTTLKINGEIHYMWRLDSDGVRDFITDVFDEDSIPDFKPDPTHDTDKSILVEKLG